MKKLTLRHTTSKDIKTQTWLALKLTNLLAALTFCRNYHRCSPTSYGHICLGPCTCKGETFKSISFVWSIALPGSSVTAIHQATFPLLDWLLLDCSVPFEEVSTLILSPFAVPTIFIWVIWSSTPLFSLQECMCQCESMSLCICVAQL